MFAQWGIIGAITLATFRPKGGHSWHRICIRGTAFDLAFETTNGWFVVYLQWLQRFQVFNLMEPGHCKNLRPNSDAAMRNYQAVRLIWWRGELQNVSHCAGLSPPWRPFLRDLCFVFWNADSDSVVFAAYNLLFCMIILSLKIDTFTCHVWRFHNLANIIIMSCTVLLSSLFKDFYRRWYMYIRVTMSTSYL